MLDLDTVHEGDCLDLLKQIPTDTIDALATDPPAGVAFQGLKWDKFRADHLSAAIQRYLGACNPDLVGFQEFLVAVFKECYRVLKPGGHGVVWALPRTSHHTAMALERVGFQTREIIPHLFGSGMPKSLNVGKAAQELAPEQGKAWEGWGTGLKPSVEFWLLVRKPLQEPNVARQVLATGTGALNVDACRVPHADAADFEHHKKMVDRIRERGGSMGNSWKNSSDLSGANEVTAAGRWPANAVLSHSVDCETVYTPNGSWAVVACSPGCPIQRLNVQSGITVSRPDLRDTGKMDSREAGWRFERRPSQHADTGGASRFFTTFTVDLDDPFRYCPKPSPSEKDAAGVPNTHPTSKPLALMRWFCRLVAPLGATILDPFAGSGTTCVAAVHEQQHFIGIEQEPQYIEIARARISHALTTVRNETVYQENYDAQFDMPQE